MFFCGPQPAIIIDDQPEQSYLAALAAQYKQGERGRFEELLDRIFVEKMWLMPQSLTFIGIFESLGLRDHNRCLNDLSISAARHRMEKTKSHWISLLAYPTENLSDDQKLSRQLISWQLEQEIKGEEFLFYDCPVNQLWGVTQELSSLFMNAQPLNSTEDSSNYIARLGKIGAQFDQVIERIEYQKANGITPPRFAIAKAVASLEKWLQIPIENNPLVKRLADAKQVMTTKVLPAYQKLYSYLQQYLTLLEKEDGAWALTNGDAYYAYLLKRHTTLDITPKEVHEIGLKEVARIEKEIEQLLKKEGLWNGKLSVGAHLKQLGEDPKYFYPNTDEGRAACLKKFEEILARSRKVLGACFSIQPKSQVHIERVPPHEENGAPGAYYTSASLDGSRPGVFYVNLRDLHSLPTYRMETLTIHEAEPGHHYERSLTLESNAHILRKRVQNTAFIEGWALYVEKLGFEQGFYSSSIDQIGHLQDELVRAARLVVDTGIHWKRWSRAEAIAYFSAVVGMDAPQIISEIERYFVMPGQACAYKIGQLKFLELRQEAKKRLGDQFDLKEFHSSLLNRGVLPLSMLHED
jgi:uncharacterized protein (DUF885 family)